MIELKTPLDERTVRKLKLGDIVSLSGELITGRDEMHMRVLKNIADGGYIPSAIEGSVLYHCGPIITEDDKGWKVVAAGPTTSARMNKLEPEMIRHFNIRAIIGKGGMSKEVGKAMSEVGCVYLAAVGGTAVSLAESVTEVKGVEWRDLGMAEAVWRLKVDNVKPLIVAMDADGGSLYENTEKSLIRDI